MSDVLPLDITTYPYFYLGLCLAVLGIVVVLVTRLSGSRFGLALRSFTAFLISISFVGLRSDQHNRESG